MKKQNRKILIVDDKEQLLEDWNEFLEEENLGIITTESDVERAIELNKTERFDLALLDVRLEQKLDGIDVLRAIRKDTPRCYCIMITAFNDLGPATDALKLDANDYLIKGILKKNDLIRAVKNGIRWLELKEENGKLEKEKNNAEMLKLKAEIKAKSERERYADLLQFAAGMIHEISPLIIPMKTYIERESKEYRKDALQLVHHLSSLNNQLKEYVCGIVKPMETDKLDIADIIEDSIVLVGKKLEGIELVDTYAEKPQKYLIKGNSDKLHIVFRNLITNAVEAIQIRRNVESELKGKITIAFSNTGEKVKVLVSDNGCGIQDVDKPKILKPFVTSKSEGIGLGMAIVKTIVENHNGELSFESQVNEETTFSVELPLIGGISN